MLHHLDYAQQLDHKQTLLSGHLQRVGIEPVQWLASVSAGQLGYRRKARLGVRMVGDRVLVGFRESFSNRVADLSACVTLTPQISRLLQPLGELITGLSVARQVPQIEVAQGESGARREHPTLMLRHLVPLLPQDRQALLEFQTKYEVEILLQSGGYDSLVTLAGAAPSLLGYRLADDGLELKFKPEQFIQINLAANREMVRQALCLLDGGGNALRQMRVVDLFCGIGNFTLPLARRGAEVVGFEGAADAVERASDNARHNGLDVAFYAADLYADVSTGSHSNELTAQLAQADALILDPPRSGAGPNLRDWLAHFTGEAVLYISCNPESFAQDALLLQADGFVLQRVGIFDMFPNTAHVETMGLFTRRG